MYPQDELANLTEKILAYGYLPVDILITGATGSGKSTTINRLIGNNVTQADDSGAPQTKEISAHNLGGIFRIWDSPGLGDSTKNDQTLEHKLKQLEFKKHRIVDSNLVLKHNPIANNSANAKCLTPIHRTKADAAVLIINGDNRDLATPFKTLEMLLRIGYREEIIIGINFIDKYLHGKGWDYEYNRPLRHLEAHSLKVENSILKRLYDDFGISFKNCISFSALHSYKISGILKESLNTFNTNTSLLFDWLSPF